MANISPRRHKNGTVSWRVQYRINGKGRQETFQTETAAERFQDLVHRVGGEQAREILVKMQNPDPASSMREAVRQQAIKVMDSYVKDGGIVGDFITSPYALVNSVFDTIWYAQHND